MIHWGMPQYWYGEYISSPVRAGMRSQFKGKVQSELEMATQMLGYGGIGLGHVLLGGAKYAYLANVGVKLERARSTLWKYQMAQAEKRALISGLIGKGSVRSKMLYNIARSPGKAAALKASRFVRIAGRLHPLGLAASLAYDLYDVYANRSFWGWKIPG